MGAINDIAEGFSKNQLIGYFLILWAATFFFSSISGFVGAAEGHWSSIADVIIDVLWSLVELGAAGVLVLLGFKFLNEKQ
jgi:hypothetical protein